ncbi:hypothetical protein IIV31_172R [Armadillidium vulgare iridescent virus]|uniref:Uncharacterized protein n=1 Tax=Armadillidium vulgare iridescent virus TaxID=72201 RepID=A0A068QLR6_9VIRU|nr:hypothetical protein IIV31_172R [Armadillidium vulgare iridescent virus]CCV02544.1 hypothetical protein IIV31_172R [Armadillidium vulgare iridescent virus]
MNTTPLSKEQLENAHFNLVKSLTPQQKQLMADFGKNMYSNFDKYQTPSEGKSQPPSLPFDQKFEQLMRMIESGLLQTDLKKSEIKMLKKVYGNDWKQKLFNCFNCFNCFNF